MTADIVAAELKMRLNSQIKCDEFFKFAQNQPELITADGGAEKCSYMKRCCSI